MIATPRPARAGIGLLSASAYAGMFVFGIVMALLGAVLPALSGRFELRVADIGTLFLAMNLAMLACSSFIGLAIDRFGMKPALAIGPLLVAAALALIARASQFGDLIPAVVAVGLGGGALNAATNTLVADLHEDPRKKSAALNVLGVFFGIGALFLPFCVGALLATFGIGALLISAGGLCLLAALFAASLSYPSPKQPNRLPVADMPKFLCSPLVILMGLLLFLESGIEFTMGGFISTYLTRGFSMSVSAASWALAAYWAAIMLARVAWSRILAVASPVTLVILCALAALAGSATASSAAAPMVAVIGICVAGLALSGIFPTILGVAGAAFREYSGTVFGILFTAALTGGTILPWVAGRLAGSAGLAWVFGLVAAGFGLIAALGFGIRRVITSPPKGDFA